MPLPQNQSDDDESGPSKEDKVDKQVFKNSFDASEELSKRIRPTGADKVNSKNSPMSPLRYRTVACFVTGSSPVPLKTRRVGQRCTLNLSRAETSSRWCGVVVRRGECQLRCRPRHLTMVQNYVVRRQKSPRVAEQCDVNIQSINQSHEILRH
ncbi:uncharacterized protein TNCV_4285691 [Trichonephila clavipes]|nr:uncharacterized protein TNCV_4285691 [Trichonephila clavipes]